MILVPICYKCNTNMVRICYQCDSWGKLLNVGQDVTLHDDGTDICEIKPFFLRFGAFVVFWVAMPADLTTANLPQASARLPQAFAGFRRLPQASASFRRLPQASAGFRKLPQASAGFRRLPQASAGFCRLPQVSAGFRFRSLVTISYECALRAAQITVPGA